MTVIAFEGPAGCGKTYKLMEELVSALRRRPLAAHERVLALTFMHGSRRRLSSRLKEMKDLVGRYEAITVDSFAWRLARRWRLLAHHLGYTIPANDDYDATCALAAALAKKPSVQAWVKLSFPFVVIDEAQDLSAERSSIIAALAQSATLLLAFDEFQCLDTALLPIAIEGWLRNYCQPTTLEDCHRTDEPELLEAARAVRSGRIVALEGQHFKVKATPGRPALAATYIANAIAWRKGGNVAVVTPSRRGGFADGAVARVCTGPVGKHQNGPYIIKWESTDLEDAAAIWGRLGINEACTSGEALEALRSHAGIPAIRMLREWITHRRSTCGNELLAPADLRRQLERFISQKQRHRRVETELAAMTIQQAKNREFDHVIVLWPFTIPTDNQQRRRLLYNAITRAKRSCIVLVQSASLLQAAPFVP